MKENVCHKYYTGFKWRKMHIIKTTYANMKLYLRNCANIWCTYAREISVRHRMQRMLFLNPSINFKLINTRNIYIFFIYLIITKISEQENIRMKKIIPYCTILITNLSLVRKINILLWVCKTEKVYILHTSYLFFYYFLDFSIIITIFYLMI